MTMTVAEPDLIRAKAAAFKMMQLLGISDPQEINLEDIAMSRGVLVVDGGLQGADARLVRKNDRGIIRIKSDLSETGKRRFALAHELGHWELHKHNTQWQFCTEVDLQDYANSNMEIEANEFASEMLMPTAIFRPKCGDAIPDINLVKRLATEFQTTLTATAVRLVEESNRACFAIFSSEGKVRWWRRSKKCEYLWVEKNWEIQEDSMAWKYLQAETSEPSEMTVVEPELWFNSSCAERIGEVQEQSIKLGRYPTILTMLWLP